MDGVVSCAVTAGCVMAYGLILDARRHIRELERDKQGWNDYAARRGFRYSSDMKPFSLRSHHRVEGEVDGVALSCATGLEILHMPTTTITAHAPVPLDGRLYVSRSEVFSSGTDDGVVSRVDMGDPDFDGGEFLVKATDRGIAETALVPPVRRALMRMSASGRQSLSFRCDSDLVAVEWLGIEALPELFDLGCDLLVAACESRTRTGVYR